MDAGDYKVAIAFQERIKLPKEEMSYYEDLAEMYVGTDVSPDFYGWVFPKYDHVAVGTGTMQKNQSLIKGLQEGVRSRAKKRLVNGQVIPSEKDLKNYLKKWDKKYGTTYKVLEILQNIFYRNDSAREAFVEMCDDMDVQRLTFDSYLSVSYTHLTLPTICSV